MPYLTQLRIVTCPDALGEEKLWHFIAITLFH